jgi:hypothetical protein
MSPGAGAQWKPALAQGSGDAVYAAWIDERQRSADDDLPQAHVFYARVGHGGARRLDHGAPVAAAAKLDNAWAPSIAVLGRDVSVAWLDFQSYDWGVFARTSRNGGVSFRSEQRVPTDGSTAEELADSPTTAFLGPNPFVAWTDWRKRDSAATKPHQEYDTFISVPLGNNHQVDPYLGRQVSTFAPSLCYGGGTRGLVAFQDSSAARSSVRVMPMRGGTTRGRSHLLRGASVVGNAWRPRIACSNGRAVVVWEDERDGPARLYYAVRSARSLW